MPFTAYVTGLTIGLGLILAIGAQNAFVLRQGLRNEHVFAVSLTCALSDAILIAVGVAAFGTIAALLPWLDPAMRIAGAAFLIWFGVKSARAALTSEQALTVSTTTEKPPLKTALFTCLALTWLNPHVYLDTVVMLGTISTQFEGRRLAFAAGAITGSFLFFFSLGYGARLLRPLFARPAAWRILDGAIALVMWAIAAGLLMGA